MSKSENIQAFEAALMDNIALQDKYKAALKRIIENKEATSDGEAMVKAAAEIGFTLTMAELERKAAENQELSDDDLEQVSGGSAERNSCWYDYACEWANMHDSTSKNDVCFADYLCSFVFNDPDKWAEPFG